MCREVKSWCASHQNRRPEQLHCGDKCPLDRALWGRTRAQVPPLYTWTLQPRPCHLMLWRASFPGQTQPCHIPALHRWHGQWKVQSSHQTLGSSLLQNTLLLSLSRVHPLQPYAQILREKQQEQKTQWVLMVLTWQLETTYYRQWGEIFSFSGVAHGERSWQCLNCIWASFWRKIQDLQGQFRMADFQECIFWG